MRILFLCGSLEPGRDGVGDYTVKLAEELVRQDHQISIVALKDKYLKEVFDGKHKIESCSISLLRIPYNLDDDVRSVLIVRIVNEFNPDWISLQFVAFSFHPKGLSLQLSKFLKKIGKGRKWHIMFHELWVGMAENDNIKRKLWGKLQKLLIQRMIFDLKPKLMHTQCDLYLEQLKKDNYQVKKLSLFSNIDSLSTNLKPIYQNKYHFIDNTATSFIFFGGLHPEAKLSELISELKKNENNKPFEFLYVGRNGKELSNHSTILKQEKVKYKVFGELNTKDISYLLSISSFGISTGSPQMIEKNGTVTAMIAHSLPVICIGRNLIHSYIPNAKTLPGVYFLNDIKKLLSHRPVISPANQLSDIAIKYVNDLQQDKC